MKWLAVALLVACKGHEPPPPPPPAPAPPPRPPLAPAAIETRIAPPGELAKLRLGMSFDMAARIAPTIVTSKDNDVTVAGVKAHVTFSGDALDRIELVMPEEAVARWGARPWFDPTTGWLANYDAGTVRFVAYVPDPELMNQGARVLDQATRMLADPKTPVPAGLLDMGPQANPFTLHADDRGVIVGMPILSKRAAMSSWLALLEQRWGPAKPTTPRHWTYQAPMKIDAQLDDLGVLEIALAKP